jgi:flagellar hook-associated protein 1 FlgK
MSGALSALQTNMAALRVVSNNVANVNTTGYARRVVNLETISAGGQLAGVDISDVQRVVDQYLNQESLSAGASSANYDAQSSVFDQINALLGSVGGGTALTSRLSSVFSALGQAALSPTSSSSQTSVLNAFQNLASSISSLSNSLSDLQKQTDTQVGTAISSANDLIKQIYDFNGQIKTVSATGTTDSALEDQRDLALQKLSQLMDVRTAQQADGCTTVMTQDGISLVGNTYAQLSYTAASANGTFQPITVQSVNPQNGQTIGAAQALDPHLSGGKIKGLIDVRDGALADLQNELGSFAQGVAQSFNAQHNANSAYPPPTTLDGRDTGLLASDALNFSGKTTIAVTDSSGNLVSKIAVDFGAGTLSINGGAATGFAATVGGFVSALNSALGSNGTATFADGQLSIAATSSNGLVVQDDATTPASRGSVGFSQFFGLNDLFQASVPSVLSTGLLGSDAGGLAVGSKIDLMLKNANGDIAKQASVTIDASMTTVGAVVSALNTAMGATATFTLNSDGSITTTPSLGYPGYQVQVSDDTTQRGTTGMSFTQLFGIGTNQMAQQASGFSVTSAIAASPSRLAFVQADLSSSGAIVGSDDSSGLTALQSLETSQQTFAKVGALGQQVTSLGNYAAALYQDVATRGTTIASNKTAQDDRLTEAQSRQSSVSGVSIDEELSNMIIYQQAYSAGARMLNVVDQLYSTLLQIQ